jgi:hypothetical protein
MKQHTVDKPATIQPDLAQLRTALQGALTQFGHDPQLRRALIHAEGVVADRMGERRASNTAGRSANRVTRRQPG